MLTLTWHTCKHAFLVCLFQHNGRLGRMCGRHRIFPPAFLCCFCRACVRGWEQMPQKRATETEKWIYRWPKITKGMKRKRGCVCPLLPTGCRITERRAEQRKTGEQTCSIKLLLGLFNLTKPSACLSFAADGRWEGHAQDRRINQR